MEKFYWLPLYFKAHEPLNLDIGSNGSITAILITTPRFRRKLLDFRGKLMYLLRKWKCYREIRTSFPRAQTSPPTRALSAHSCLYNQLSCNNAHIPAGSQNSASWVLLGTPFYRYPPSLLYSMTTKGWSLLVNTVSSKPVTSLQEI